MGCREGRRFAVQEQPGGAAAESESENQPQVLIERQRRYICNVSESPRISPLRYTGADVYIRVRRVVDSWYAQ